MKERPIIMGDESVRAILEGRKTMTRRVVNSRLFIEIDNGDEPPILQDSPNFGKILMEYGRYPYGYIGDRLYVKERFAYWIGREAVAYSDMCHKSIEDIEWEDEVNIRDIAEGGKWKSPLFMPRLASRITLEITDIRVERVQDISVQDAKDEGIRVHANGCKDGLAYGCYNGDDCVKNVCRQPIEYYKQLWDQLNAKRGYPWESNPWVWVITFKVV